MHVLNLQRKRKWLGVCPQCLVFTWPSATGPSADPSLPRTSIILWVFSFSQYFNVSEGLTQATPALRRNPVSLHLQITTLDNHSIHLFMGHCSATLPSEKGPFQWGTFFFLSCSIFPLLLMGFLGSGWGGFWGCKRTPLYFVCYGSFLAHIKDMKRSQYFKAEDRFSVTVTSPTSTNEVRSEVRGTNYNIFACRPIQIPKPWSHNFNDSSKLLELSNIQLKRFQVTALTTKINVAWQLWQFYMY